MDAANFEMDVRRASHFHVLHIPGPDASSTEYTVDLDNRQQLSFRDSYSDFPWHAIPSRPSCLAFSD